MNGVDESSKDTGPMLPGFETCETATDTHLASLALGEMGVGATASRSLTSSAAASPASPSATLAGVQENPIAAGFGLSSTESFARLNPDGSWSRMYQGCGQLIMDGSLEAYSETWPKRGTMQSGSTYPLPMSERPTSGKESSSWPTPQVHETGGQGTPSWRDLECQKAGQQTREGGVVIQRKLENEVPLRSLEDEQSLRSGGSLSPTWVEWLMGFPLGWTDLEDSATP